MHTNTIDHGTLAQLVAAGAIHDTHIVGEPGGWAVLVRYGSQESALAAQRSRSTRLFRRFETLVAYLKEMGIARYEVDAARYVPGTTQGSRPDRAAALKHAHEAAAYDKWVQQQVQASLDDPRPSLSDEEARARLAERKAALRQNIR